MSYKRNFTIMKKEGIDGYVFCYHGTCYVNASRYNTLRKSRGSLNVTKFVDKVDRYLSVRGWIEDAQGRRVHGNTKLSSLR